VAQESTVLAHCSDTLNPVDSCPRSNGRESLPASVHRLRHWIDCRVHPAFDLVVVKATVCGVDTLCPQSPGCRGGVGGVGDGPVVTAVIDEPRSASRDSVGPTLPAGTSTASTISCCLNALSAFDNRNWETRPYVVSGLRSASAADSSSSPNSVLEVGTPTSL
jgi:hypothetical protein